MSKAGDWGSDPKMVKRNVRVTSDENFNGTIPTASKPQGDAPKLRFIPDPWYVKPPLDPEFKENPTVPFGG